MPPQARLGDKALITADAHGCVACPHTASGPAVAGSPNVNVNGRPAIRVDDPGIHTACCGGNTWNAQTGSKSVFINGKPAHRLGDVVRHCGGIGKCIEGSGNVFVGDLLSSGFSRHVGDKRESVVFHFYDDATKDAITNLSVKVLYPDQNIVMHRTDRNGKVIIRNGIPGYYEVIDVDDAYALQLEKHQGLNIED